MNICDELINCAADMAQEIQDTLDAMREASGDDTDGEHLALLLDRWEELFARYNAEEETE